MGDAVTAGGRGRLPVLVWLEVRGFRAFGTEPRRLDDKLVELAEQAGAGAAAADIGAGTYASYVARATEQSSKDGVTGTPRSW